MTAEEELIHLRERNRELEEQVKQLTEQLKKLQEHVAKTSQNSSLPPSSDRLARQKKARSLRTKSGKKPGGQAGHQGHTLTMSAEPTEVIPLAPVTHCQQSPRRFAVGCGPEHRNAASDRCSSTSPAASDPVRGAMETLPALPGVHLGPLSGCGERPCPIRAAPSHVGGVFDHPTTLAAPTDQRSPRRSAGRVDERGNAHNRDQTRGSPPGPGGRTDESGLEPSKGDPSR